MCESHSRWGFRMGHLTLVEGIESPANASAFPPGKVGGRGAPRPADP